jgi:hypothetical protein
MHTEAVGKEDCTSSYADAFHKCPSADSLAIITPLPVFADLLVHVQTPIDANNWMTRNCIW